MSVSVRAARPQDAHALADLAARTFPLANPPGADLADMNAFIAEHLTTHSFQGYLADPHARVLVAVRPLINDESPSSSEPSSAQGGSEGAVVTHDGVRERLIGYSLVFGGAPGIPADSFGVHQRPTAYLSKFYVDPDAHGSGVARTLMSAVREVACGDLGAASIWLAVNHQNAKAARFYEKSGFVRVGVKTMIVGNKTNDDFVYELTL